jgi:hypothetical protein
LTLSGDSASLRYLFAFLVIDERNGDISTVVPVFFAIWANTSVTSANWPSRDTLKQWKFSLRSLCC